MSSSGHHGPPVPCPGALTLEVTPDRRGSNRWEPALLLTCLELTRLACATGAAQDGFYMPEPAGHVEETRVCRGGREPPEHLHVCLGQTVALYVATRAQVLIQGSHPGCLVTNAQDGPVVGSCKDRGTRASVGAQDTLPRIRARPEEANPQKRNAGQWLPGAGQEGFSGG